MKQHKHGKGPPTPAEQQPVEPRLPSAGVPERSDPSWGKGAATALERLRRNAYRGHAPQPDKDRPDSE